LTTSTDASPYTQFANIKAVINVWKSSSTT